MRRSPTGSLPIPGVHWRGLSLQLFLFIFLPVTLVLMLVTFASLTIHQRAMRSLVGERDERAARTAAAALNEQLLHRQAAIRGLALRATDRESLDNALVTSEFLYPDFPFGMAFFSPAHELLAATADSSSTMNSSPGLMSFLDEVQQNAGANAIFSDPVLIDGEIVIYVAATPSAESPIAVGAFSPVALARRTLIGAFTPSEQSQAFLVSQNRQLIYQIGETSSAESLVDHPGVMEALRGESGTTFLGVNGSEHVITFSPIRATGWALVIEEPWESVASPLLNTTLLAPLGLIPVLLLSIIALWFGARRIVRPLQSLESLSTDLAWGKYDTIQEPVGGIEEITRLQNSLIYLAKQIQRSHAGLHSYIGAITSGQEDERQRLARELHDDTIQALIAQKQRLHMSQEKLTDGTLAAGDLEDLQALTEQTIQDLRRTIRALRPLYLEDLGLVTALQMLAQEIQEASGIHISFEHAGTERRLPPKTELSLYRIAQEAVNNVQYHAQASQATVKIHYFSNVVTLEISDDGVGFTVPDSPAEFAPHGHFGLLGIHERAELIGAHLKVQSTEGRGTLLKIVLPLGDGDDGKDHRGRGDRIHD